jgi:hypothetical protein
MSIIVGNGGLIIPITIHCNHWASIVIKIMLIPALKCSMTLGMPRAFIFALYSTSHHWLLKNKLN